MNDVGQPSERELGARAARLRVDAQGASVRAGLEAAGIACLLLKGRAFADLLYDADELRTYADTDLLVAERDRRQAEQILDDLGFDKLSNPGDHVAPDPLHAEHWYRPQDGATVDLHWRLRGSRAPAESVFAALWGHSVEAEIGGRPTRVLDPSGAALVCALHVAQHPLSLGGPGADLERALVRLPLPVWRQASELADRIEARSAFADGLRLCAAGGALADALGLPATASLGRRLSTGPGPSGATSIQWLLDHERSRDRVRLAALTLFPPPHAMREFHPLARRGRWWGLALAYLLRPLHVLSKAPAAVTHWRAARRVRQ